MNRRQSVLSVVIVAVSLLAAGCIALSRPVQPAQLAEPVTPAAPILAAEGGAAAGLLPLAVPLFPTAEWSTDFTRRTVAWEDIVSGGRLAAGDGTFTDAESGSRWNILGQAVAGELAGEQLTQLLGFDHFWFAWAAFHPQTELYSTQ